eukprot:TRINITY_DN3631_c0_g1_i2.p1 TRINITY_DN3631_c0_g1~~TRINITY_DN3631_c0_g1_i2.p1  ORF type:complete len:102 (+),score=30.16 TRINITY_DN3631_c0_g1_i2:145-450(+)
MIRRPPRSTLSSSSAASDVYKRQVHNYSIHLLPETRQLFGYAEIECEEKWAAIANTEICQKWWAHMGDVMPSNADNSPVTAETREVFYICLLYTSPSPRDS